MYIWLRDPADARADNERQLSWIIATRLAAIVPSGLMPAEALIGRQDHTRAGNAAVQDISACARRKLDGDPVAAAPRQPSAKTKGSRGNKH